MDETSGTTVTRSGMPRSHPPPHGCPAPRSGTLPPSPQTKGLPTPSPSSPRGSGGIRVLPANTATATTTSKVTAATIAALCCRLDSHLSTLQPTRPTHHTLCAHLLHCTQLRAFPPRTPPNYHTDLRITTFSKCLSFYSPNSTHHQPPNFLRVPGARVILFTSSHHSQNSVSDSNLFASSPSPIKGLYVRLCPLLHPPPEMAREHPAPGLFAPTPPVFVHLKREETSAKISARTSLNSPKTQHHAATSARGIKGSNVIRKRVEVKPFPSPGAIRAPAIY